MSGFPYSKMESMSQELRFQTKFVGKGLAGDFGLFEFMGEREWMT